MWSIDIAKATWKFQGIWAEFQVFKVLTTQVGKVKVPCPILSVGGVLISLS